ncbi:MAG: ATP-dependent DNA helicase RecG, partial [Gammaproteobacteria bacterium]|nr:ATP-dependent DNA helicase RecG [Gammaproteobacteria bacterium]
VVYLSGSIKGKSRDQIISEMHKGKAQVVIGTHALFQKGVEFQSLALIVIDEQHRFGVEQRAQMRSKGTRSEYYPHQLILTATPIPRTLAMSLYADLECSTIDELPPGRTPIVTSIICNNRRSDVISRIREACKLHKQVYWVCPLIDESDVLNCESAILTHTQLQQSLSEFKVGLVHGRMPNQEKQETMQLFKENKIQILVATTVIEVGVDVPNACVMVIENAERLGLSQLHQLRGRVGRGQQASFCLLMYQSPLTQIAKERLTVLRDHTDGFKIAQRDLELRGPGEFIGTRQTGDLTFLVADLLRDQSCLKAVQEAADIIFHQYPQLVKPLVDRLLTSA